MRTIAGIDFGIDCKKATEKKTRKQKCPRVWSTKIKITGSFILLDNV